MGQPCLGAGMANSSCNPHIKFKTAQENPGSTSSWAASLLTSSEEDPGHKQRAETGAATAVTAAASAATALSVLRSQRFAASRDAQMQRVRNVSSIVADGQLLELPAAKRDTPVAGSLTARSKPDFSLYKGPVVMTPRFQPALELPGETRTP